MNKNENKVLRREISKFLAIQYFTCPDLEEIIAGAFYDASFNCNTQEVYSDKRIEIQEALYSEINRRKNQGELLTSDSLMEYLLHTFENYHLKFCFVQKCNKAAS